MNTPPASLTDADWLALSGLSTPAVCNAIETFRVRTRNEGFIAHGPARRIELPQALAGYALTMRMKTSTPPPTGFDYIDRMEWWQKVSALPRPKVVVIEDVDEEPGFGAVAGEIRAAIFKAFGAVGIVTNGAFRDIAALARMGMHGFSGSVSPSHAYAHVVDVGAPVEIAGVRIATGDILHGDESGLALIPHAIAAEIPRVAAAMAAQERRILERCQAPNFAPDDLRNLLSELKHLQDF